jgi:hypothetical protein
LFALSAVWCNRGNTVGIRDHRPKANEFPFDLFDLSLHQRQALTIVHLPDQGILDAARWARRRPKLPQRWCRFVQRSRGFIPITLGGLLKLPPQA